MHALIPGNLRHELPVAEHPRIVGSAAVEVDVLLRRNAVEHEPAVRLGGIRTGEARLSGAQRQQAQSSRGSEPGNLARAEVRAVTAQLIVVGIAYAPAAHRKQVQIANQLQQVSLRIDQQSLVALLEQMPRLVLAAMHAPRVLAAEPL